MLNRAKEKRESSGRIAPVRQGATRARNKEKLCAMGHDHKSARTNRLLAFLKKPLNEDAEMRVGAMENTRCKLCGGTPAFSLMILGQAICAACERRLLRSDPASEEYGALVREMRTLLGNAGVF